jgi:hypothetical protein
MPGPPCVEWICDGSVIGGPSSLNVRLMTVSGWPVFGSVKDGG